MVVRVSHLRLVWRHRNSFRNSNSGDHVIAMDDLYGGTYRLFEDVRKRSSGLEFSFVDLSDSKKLRAIRPNTK